jgi:phosphopantothenoylcysteine synthetase/decarboxylase
VKVLITCGPTREYIDDVRFLSNASSGRMGRALTQAALGRGHEVTVVHGPMDACVPRGAKAVPVTSAREMRKRVLEYFNQADVVLMAAAVADWRPDKIFHGKLKKKGGPPDIRLVRNPDILAGLGRIKTRQVIVAFALESENLIENAKAKLKKKRADLVAANSPAAIGARRGVVHIIDSHGNVTKLGPASKRAIAEGILDAAEALA